MIELGKQIRLHLIFIMTFLNICEVLSCIVGSYPLFYTHCSIMYIYCAIIFFITCNL